MASGGTDANSNKLKQTQVQVDEVVGIMRTNVEKVRIIILLCQMNVVIVVCEYRTVLG